MVSPCSQKTNSVKLMYVCGFFEVRDIKLLTVFPTTVMACTTTNILQKDPGVKLF